MKDERDREIPHQVGQQQLHHEHSVTKQSCGLLASKSLMPIASLECEYLLPLTHLPNPIQFNGLNPPKPQKSTHTHTRGEKKKKKRTPPTNPDPRQHKISPNLHNTLNYYICQILFIAKRINHTHHKHKKRQNHTQRERENLTPRGESERQREKGGGGELTTG